MATEGTAVLDFKLTIYSCTLQLYILQLNFGYTLTSLVMQWIDLNKDRTQNQNHHMLQMARSHMLGHAKHVLGRQTPWAVQ